MATTTPNYGLKKPDATDPFGDFRTDYNNNMDIIDANLGGGGGSGHTIVDENDQTMPARTYLKFAGDVAVTDDSGNDETVVTVTGGASSLSGLSDVNLTTPSDGQVLTYDGNSSEWVNANASGGGDSVSWNQIQASGTKIAEIDINGVTTDVYAPSGGGGGGHTYSTSEQVVGTWLGETLYERSFVHTGNIANTNYATIDNSYSPSNTGVMFVEHICFKLSGHTTLYASYTGQTLDVGIESAGKLYVENFTGETVTKVWLTIRYTKI